MFCWPVYVVGGTDLFSDAACGHYFQCAYHSVANRDRVMMAATTQPTSRNDPGCQTLPYRYALMLVGSTPTQPRLCADTELVGLMNGTACDPVDGMAACNSAARLTVYETVLYGVAGGSAILVNSLAKYLLTVQSDAFKTAQTTGHNLV